MKKQKKIYLYVTTDITYDQRMQRIAAALSESDYDVTLVGRKKVTTKSTEFSAFHVRRLKCIFNKGALFYVEFNIKIFWHILFHRMDAACAVDLDTLSGVTTAAKLKGIPVVFDAHEWYTEVPELLGRSGVRNLWKRIERRFVPLTKARYTVNGSLAEVFTEQHQLPFHVVRNVPFVEKLPAIKKENHVILYQGALNKGRGIEVSILAMKQLVNFELWLAGEGDLSDSLRVLAKNEGVAKQVKFLGYKTPSELKIITRKAHIGLNLLEGTSKNYFYSLANKFFDYMQAGVPSINMKFPEYEAILNEYPCGLMLTECTTEQLVNAVRQISNDENYYHNLVKSATAASKIFNWENEKLALLNIWQQLIEN